MYQVYNHKHKLGIGNIWNQMNKTNSDSHAYIFYQFWCDYIENVLKIQEIYN